MKTTFSACLVSTLVAAQDIMEVTNSTVEEGPTITFEDIFALNENGHW